ncbi:CBS domain-containing protein [Candidatus Gottesmanbacteria bacterium]|nr:CBS domain-containing protein [Candidatus Gottesmanbacteria bacterium]
MKVHEVMSLRVVTVYDKSKLKDLWKAIFKLHIHALPVVDAKNRLVGIVSEEDLLKPLYSNYQQYIEDFVSASDFEEMEGKIVEVAKLLAKDVMCPRVIFTRVDTPAMRALSRMLVRNVHQLPVLDNKDRIVGMITKGDIFDALFRRHLKKHTNQSVRESKKRTKKK